MLNTSILWWPTYAIQRQWTDHRQEAMQLIGHPVWLTDHKNYTYTSLTLALTDCHSLSIMIVEYLMCIVTFQDSQASKKLKEWTNSSQSQVILSHNSHLQNKITNFDIRILIVQKWNYFYSVVPDWCTKCMWFDFVCNLITKWEPPL